MFKIERMFKNLFKNIVFFKFSGSIPETRRAFGLRMVKWGGLLPFKDKQ